MKEKYFLNVNCFRHFDCFTFIGVESINLSIPLTVTIKRNLNNILILIYDIHYIVIASGK